MQHTARTPRQLPLMSVGDLGPPDDPVGVALGIVGDDDASSSHVWREVMDLFGHIATRAYLDAQAESEASPEC